MTPQAQEFLRQRIENEIIQRGLPHLSKPEWKLLRFGINQAVELMAEWFHLDDTRPDGLKSQPRCEKCGRPWSGLAIDRNENVCDTCAAGGTIGSLVSDSDLTCEEIAAVIGAPVQLVAGWFDAWMQIDPVSPDDGMYVTGYIAGKAARAEMNRSATAAA